MSPVTFAYVVLVTRMSERTLMTEVDSVWTHNFLASRRVAQIRDETPRGKHMLVASTKHVLMEATEQRVIDALRRAE